MSDSSSFTRVPVYQRNHGHNYINQLKETTIHCRSQESTMQALTSDWASFGAPIGRKGLRVESTGCIESRRREVANALREQVINYNSMNVMLKEENLKTSVITKKINKKTARAPSSFQTKAIKINPISFSSSIEESDDTRTLRRASPLPQSILKMSSSFSSSSDERTESAIPNEIVVRNNPNKNSNNIVSFAKVHIREYDLIPGDNPACSSGVPLSLGWKFDPLYDDEYPIDVFENHRYGQRVDKIEELKLCKQERYMILNLDWNFSNSAITKAERECRIVQHGRKRTRAILIQNEGEDVDEDYIISTHDDLRVKARKLCKTVMRNVKKKLLSKQRRKHASA